jgi:hypothetical protein
MDDGVGAVRNRYKLRSYIQTVERGGSATCGLDMGTRTGVVLVLRRKFGSSFLCGGLGGGCFRCCGSFLLSIIGAAAL